MPDELVNKIVLSLSKTRLRSLRFARFFAQAMTFGFALVFAYLILREPQLNTAVVLSLGGSLIGVFAGSSVLSSLSAEIATQKIVVKLAGAGLMGMITGVLTKGVDDK